MTGYHQVPKGVEVKYQMRERMFAIGDDYWIETDGGHPAYKVDGKALRIRNTLVLEAPEGGEVFTIQKKLLSIRDTMEIERDGKTVATVKKALVSPLRDRFSIEVEDGEDMEAKGNIVDHEYKIQRGGDEVAEVSKRWLRMRDVYGIEIAEGENDALILAVTVCIDQISHSEAA
ncbi:MAG TPA: LURP-one-related family protein [Gaiellaceae bacterium]|nr:LURP-one-related family protein [Gaiellaceae bacterium]HET8650934.1 LURP-one-related family protein [Gaiellaceae bacterium]